MAGDGYAEGYVSGGMRIGVVSLSCHELFGLESRGPIPVNSLCVCARPVGLLVVEFIALVRCLVRCAWRRWGKNSHCCSSVKELAKTQISIRSFCDSIREASEERKDGHAMP